MVPMAEVNRVLALLYPATDQAMRDAVGEPVREPIKCRSKKTKIYPQVAQYNGAP